MHRIMTFIVAAGLALVAGSARATTIEGYTPSGKFKTVGVTEAGKLQVETSTGTAYHVVVDSGNIVAAQGAPGSQPWPVTTSVGVSLTVSASTAAVPVQAAFATDVPASIIYPADSDRKQGVLCNDDPSRRIYIGDSGITAGVGAYIPPGGCLSPDVPSRMVGALYGASTAPASGFYIYWR